MFFHSISPIIQWFFNCARLKSKATISSKFIYTIFKTNIMLFSAFNYSLLLSAVISLVGCHVFRLGECPEVEPMPDFDIDRFLGEWYVVQKFRSASDCVKENFTRIGDHFYVRSSARPLGSPVVTTISGLLKIIIL